MAFNQDSKENKFYCNNQLQTEIVHNELYKKLKGSVSMTHLLSPEITYLRYILDSNEFLHW